MIQTIIHIGIGVLFVSGVLTIISKLFSGKSDLKEPFASVLALTVFVLINLIVSAIGIIVGLAIGIGIYKSSVLGISIVSFCILILIVFDARI